jgi:hypothetical protein
MRDDAARRVAAVGSARIAVVDACSGQTDAARFGANVVLSANISIVTRRANRGDMRHAELSITRIGSARVAVVDVDQRSGTAASGCIARVVQRAGIPVVAGEAGDRHRAAATSGTLVGRAWIVVVTADGSMVAATRIAAVGRARVAVITSFGDDPTADAHDRYATEHAARWKVFVEATIAIVVDPVARGVAWNTAQYFRIGFSAATSVWRRAVGDLQSQLLGLHTTSHTGLVGATEHTQRN